LEDALVMSLLEAAAGTPWPTTDPRLSVASGVIVVLRPDLRACTAVVSGGSVDTGFGPIEGDWPSDWQWTLRW
jgi:hypothetical protein